MFQMWVLIHLTVLAVEDYLEGLLFLPVIAELGIVGAVRCVLSGTGPELLPGLLTLAFGKLSKEQIGYGDGWLLLALGFWLESQRLYQTVFLGILLCCVGAFLSRKKELPFVPFLTAAYLLIGGWR